MTKGITCEPENPSMIVTNWANHYKLTHGKEPSAAGLRVICHLDKVGRMFQSQGLRDAKLGCNPATEADFVARSMKQYANDPEWAKLLSGLAYSYYMDGYKQGLRR